MTNWQEMPCEIALRFLAQAMYLEPAMPTDGLLRVIGIEGPSIETMEFNGWDEA